MKILYIANARMPTEKAHGYQIIKMCEAFSKAGIDLELVVPWRFNPVKENPFDYYSVERSFKITKLPSLDLVKIGSLGFLIQSVSFAKVSAFYALFKKADIIYSRDELPLFFLILFLRLKKKFFWESHSAKINFMAKKVLKKSDGIITLTKVLKDFYTEGFKAESEKILVAPDSVDLSVFDIEVSKEEAREKTDLPKDKVILAYFGRFRTMGMEKGLSILLESLKNLPPNFFFVAVGGSQEDIEFYKKQAEELSVSDRVLLKPIISRKELSIWQKSCDILLMPFPDLPHYRYYMSPLKMFEYMASERPIIASDLPSVREILNEDNAVLVPPSDPKSLGEAIKKLSEDRDFGDKLSAQAFKDVKQYTWDRRAERIINFVNKVKS